MKRIYDDDLLCKGEFVLDVVICANFYTLQGSWVSVEVLSLLLDGVYYFSMSF